MAPKGPSEVRVALIEAAIDSFSSGGKFSVREVAKSAGVNHGQVHHLFGGKDGLKQAMLDYLVTLQAEAIQAAEPQTHEELARTAADVLLHDDRFARILARRLLEVPSGQKVQGHFPVVRMLRAALDDEEKISADAELKLAEDLARALGWVFFGPWIRQAADLSEAVCSAMDARIGEADGY